MKFGGELDETRVAPPYLTLESVEDVQDVCEAFKTEYAYGQISIDPESGIEVENFVLKGTAARETLSSPSHETQGADPSHARTEERVVYWTSTEEFQGTPI
jgi:hypothetical protein